MFVHRHFPEGGLLSLYVDQVRSDLHGSIVDDHHGTRDLENPLVQVLLRRPGLISSGIHWRFLVKMGYI